MAVYRDVLGNINRQEFENHLKATVRNKTSMEILMYIPDPNIQIASIASTDKSNTCDINSIIDINKYTSSTIATLEENLWLLNGRFINYQGEPVDGYISNSISDANGDFDENPTINVQLSHPSKVEDFSVILNSSVPTGYPKTISVHCFDENDNYIDTYEEYIEWEEDTGEVDENDIPIYRTKLLDTLPSVNISINENNVDHLVVEFDSTRFRHRRIRVSSIMFGKTLVFTENDITNADYSDKTSYVCDTLPSRVFNFTLNNYDGKYNIDNPENSYLSLDKNTRIRFRIGYNVYGYQYDQNGYVIMQDGKPVMNYSEDGEEIEWDNWVELRFKDISINADESVTFTAGSLLDIMEDTYTKEIYLGEARTVQEIVDDILTSQGLDLNSIEWSSDGIKKPTYNNNQLLPYEQWSDTAYNEYTINTPMPEAPCKQIIQLLAFSVGATILIKDNGKVKFANLNITKPESFTNHYEWSYEDFTSIPSAEQLESVYNLSEISLPKYLSYLDYSGEERIVVDGSVYANCTIVSTVTCTSATVEVTYGECLPIGCKIAQGDTSGATIVNSELYCRRGIITLGGYTAGQETTVEILGYPIKTKQTQERNVTSDSLVLDTKIMNYDVATYNPNGSGAKQQTEQIKRKYLNWYRKKFKYKFGTRGEPLVRAGDYAIIQTQFTQQMPVYILQNDWSYDGAFSGNMEVIALG